MAASRGDVLRRRDAESKVQEGQGTQGAQDRGEEAQAEEAGGAGEEGGREEVVGEEAGFGIERDERVAWLAAGVLRPYPLTEKRGPFLHHADFRKGSVTVRIEGREVARCG